jgi:aminoglycoside N3'-acetyltransferase
MPTDFAGDYVEASKHQKLLCLTEGKSNRGHLTEIFRKLPDVVRSTNPIYTVSVYGSGLEKELESHWECQYSMDIGSPWDSFAKRGGKIVFFGCDYNVNSFIHHPEYILKSEYPLPVFFNRPHLFKVRNLNAETKLVRSFVHAINWPAGTVEKFCNYLNDKYRIYKTVDVSGTVISVVNAQHQYDSLVNELKLGNTWYAAELF